jgi:hypothetical protein
LRAPAAGRIHHRARREHRGRLGPGAGSPQHKPIIGR